MGIGLGLAALVAMGCGGGKNSFVGVGNSGNRIFADELEEVAEDLHAWPGVPQVSEQDLGRIYQALVQRAREGNPQAACVVLVLAELQREARAAGEDG
jgi:hypothetical protein